MGLFAAATPNAVYDGGGTDNALQVFTTTALMIAGADPEVIDIGVHNELDIWLMNSTASQSCTLVVAEFTTATPTAATLTKVTEVAVGTGDQTFTSDRAAWGLVTGTEYPAKDPVQVRVTPGRYAVVFCSAALGGTFYARVGKQKVAD